MFIDEGAICDGNGLTDIGPLNRNPTQEAIHVREAFKIILQWDKIDRAVYGPRGVKAPKANTCVIISRSERSYCLCFGGTNHHSHSTVSVDLHAECVSTVQQHGSDSKKIDSLKKPSNDDGRSIPCWITTNVSGAEELRKYSNRQ
ncbi:hypothetical protein EVAR_17491_1 [Eumeta japonica]|uniref:Uncharacterized protein n=1 Tax=Eumeta variegata TaxID=151549 RepID=A0A4C1ZFN6_EUMVA|nr:hypothetical protein EVAR_17491_1 [Eumeta japonica]